MHGPASLPVDKRASIGCLYGGLDRLSRTLIGTASTRTAPAAMELVAATCFLIVTGTRGPAAYCTTPVFTVPAQKVLFSRSAGDCRTQLREEGRSAIRRDAGPAQSYRPRPSSSRASVSVVRRAYPQSRIERVQQCGGLPRHHCAYHGVSPTESGLAEWPPHRGNASAGSGLYERDLYDFHRRKRRLRDFNVNAKRVAPTIFVD